MAYFLARKRGKKEMSIKYTQAFFNQKGLIECNLKWNWYSNWVFNLFKFFAWSINLCFEWRNSNWFDFPVNFYGLFTFCKFLVHFESHPLSFFIKSNAQLFLSNFYYTQINFYKFSHFPRQKSRHNLLHE